MYGRDFKSQIFIDITTTETASKFKIHRASITTFLRPQKCVVHGKDNFFDARIIP